MRPFAFAALLAAVSPAVALAHRMDLEVTAAGPVVRAVVGYEDGTPCEGATVTLSANGTVVATGTTGETGLCEFPRPAAGAYTVAADDHAGHKVSLTLTVPESMAELATAATAKRNRWLMTAAGLAAIAVVTLVARRVVRR